MALKKFEEFISESNDKKIKQETKINESIVRKYGEKSLRLLEAIFETFENNNIEMHGDSTPEDGPGFSMYVKPKETVTIRATCDSEEITDEVSSVFILGDILKEEQITFGVHTIGGYDLYQNDIETIIDDDFETLLKSF